MVHIQRNFKLNIFFRALYTLIFMLIITRNAFPDNCISPGKALILAPFDWEDSKRSRVYYNSEIEMLESSGVFDNVEILYNDQANLTAFTKIKNGNYSYIHISTHGNGSGSLCTGEEVQEGKKVKEEYKNKYFIAEIRKKNFLCIKSDWWKNTVLNNKAIIVTACSFFADTYKYKGEKKQNPIFSVFDKINHGPIVGHNDKVIVPFGSKFISNYLLESTIGNALGDDVEMSTAVENAKSEYFETAELSEQFLNTLTLNFIKSAGSSVTAINGEQFFLKCENKDSSFNLTGSWSDGYGLTANLTQTGNNLSGTVYPGYNCFPSGTVTGTINGNSIEMGATSSGNSVITYTGTISSNNHMSGEWFQQSGNCPITSGSWELNK